MVEELDEIVLDEKPGRRLFPGVANYLLDTIQVNMVKTGEQINIVPKEASALIDVRLLPDMDEQKMLDEIHAILGERIAVEVLLSTSGSDPSPIDNDIYRCLESLLSPSAPVVPAFIPGVTDSRYYRAQGVPAYGFSPFAPGAGESGGIHAADERISRSSFLKGLEIYSNVVSKCSGS
jgi:acetylornithine deacetylase/succinyl-diaminopimelate desuccinylase-like protein